VVLADLGPTSGVLGGLINAGLTRVTTRPVVAPWITTLELATIDSILIATLPEVEFIRHFEVTF
jgi:hypothetical protein